MLNNIIKGGEDNTLGGAIQNLIDSNIRLINTAFIAKVVNINDNKVDIIDVIKNDETKNNVVIPNIMVGQPLGGNYKIQYPIKINDIGLAIICKKDISTYKKSGKESTANTKRVFNISDSIFIPLSLYKQATIDNNLIIGNENTNININDDINIKSSEINLNAKSNLSLQGQLLILKSQNDSLKSVLSNLADLISNLIVDTPQGVGSINVASKQLLTQWKTALNKLLKE